MASEREVSCYFLCGPSINLYLVLQERRIAREPSNSHSDDQQTNRNASKLGDRRFDGASASDTSEGDSGGNHHQPTRWR